MKCREKKQTDNLEAGLVSVLMPVYNGEKYLKEAIESVQQQIYPNWELLIVDDGSSDSSRELAKAFSGPRIRVLTIKHGGLVKALNYGIQNLRGEYFARLDSDDRWEPHHLSQSLEILQINPKTCAVYSAWRVIEESGEEIVQAGRIKDYAAKNMAEIQDKLPVRNCLVGPSLVTHTKIIKEFPFWRLAQQMEDYHWSLKLIALGGQISISSKPTYFYRLRSDSISHSANYNGLNRRFALIKLDAFLAGVKHGQFHRFHRQLLKQIILHVIRDFRFQISKIYKVCSRQ